MVSQHVAVIRCEGHDGVRRQSLFTQRSQNHPDLVIDVGDGGVESPSRPVDLAWNGHAHAELVHVRLDAVGQVFERLGPVAADHGVEFQIAVEIEIRGRRPDRWVRSHEGEVPETGLPVIAAPDGAAHLRRRPVGGVTMVGQVPGPGEVVVVAEAAGVLLSRIALIGQVELPVVGVPVIEVMPPFLVEDHFVEADAVALGIDMELADGMSLITGLPEEPGERRNLFRVRYLQILVEDPVPVVSRRKARHQASTCGNTDGTGGVGTVEVDAVAGHLGDRGSHHHRMSCRTGEESGPAGSADEQHVGPFFRHDRVSEYSTRMRKVPIPAWPEPMDLRRSDGFSAGDSSAGRVLLRLGQKRAPTRGAPYDSSLIS